MDRETGRHEGDDLETIEAEDAGPPAAGPPAGPAGPVAGPPAGPPEHWLAYIRARAPGLLAPGGPLAVAATWPGPDVIPHGTMVGQPIPLSVAEVVGTGTRPPVAPTVAPPEVERGAVPSSGAASRDPFGDPAARPTTIVTTTTAEPAAAADPTPAEAPGRDRQAPETDTGAARRRIDAGERAPRSATDDDRMGVISGRVDPIPGTLGASPAGTLHSSTVGPTSPGQVAAPRNDPWPALARADLPATPPADPFATRAPLLSLTLPSSSSLPSSPPDDGPRTTAAAAASTDGWPARWPFAPPPADGVEPARLLAHGWRIEATRPDGHIPADLPLPAWPTLPSEPPDDGPDWPSLERRLERAARLDLEQRRR